MTFFEKIFEFFSVNPVAQSALAGALGGVVRWTTARDNWREGAGAVVVGCICAIYLPQFLLALLNKWFDINLPEDSNNLAGFILGMVGVTFTGMIMDFFKIKARLEREDDDEK